ncbi:MAG: selenoneine biosynthesis selenosugar synthase SenB [Burkholderiales bacterium]
MSRIVLVTPARAGARSGNRHTAQRWAGFLRADGHRVAMSTTWDGTPCDVMLALHARRSHEAIARFRAAHPRGGLCVALTGTDLYRDLPASAEARLSLAWADRLIVLQSEARHRLPSRERRKARVVYQSSDVRARRAAPSRVFRIAVVGHLREEKDPFRAAAALAHLPPALGVEVVQVGGALSPAMAREARRCMAREPRYRWLGSLPHARALGWIARSHVLVVSSRMEGGANVIAEAARLRVPVLASRIEGNVGMLGRGYPGYYRTGDSKALSRLIHRAQADADFYARLQRAMAARRSRHAPSAERSALSEALRGMRPRSSSTLLRAGASVQSRAPKPQ